MFAQKKNKFSSFLLDFDIPFLELINHFELSFRKYLKFCFFEKRKKSTQIIIRTIDRFTTIVIIETLFNIFLVLAAIVNSAT